MSQHILINLSVGRGKFIFYLYFYLYFILFLLPSCLRRYTKNVVFSSSWWCSMCLRGLLGDELFSTLHIQRLKACYTASVRENTADCRTRHSPTRLRKRFGTINTGEWELNISKQEVTAMRHFEPNPTLTKQNR